MFRLSEWLLREEDDEDEEDERERSWESRSWLDRELEPEEELLRWLLELLLLLWW